VVDVYWLLLSRHQGNSGLHVLCHGRILNEDAIDKSFSDLLLTLW
jgi:hypothetical protein